MLIIGISGKLKSGKDTVADLIGEALPDFCPDRHFYKVGFADDLYRQVSQATGQTVAYIKEHKDNFRKILQGWGTDYRREMCGQDYWVDRMLVTLCTLNSRSLVVIPDVRFLNERAFIEKSKGCALWRVWRPMNGPIDMHPSEQELKEEDKWDLVIRNEFDLGYLKQTVRAELHKLLTDRKLI